MARNRLFWVCTIFGAVLTGMVDAQRPPESPLLRRTSEAMSEPAERLPLIEFRDLPLDESMRLLAQQSGLKIVPSGEASKLRVSMYLRDVSALDALASLVRMYRLQAQRDPRTGIISLATFDETQRDTAAFRDETTRVFNLMYPNALDAARAIRDLHGEGSGVQVSVVPKHNQVVVRTGDAASMGRIADLICKLDVPTAQVLLEVKVLSLDLGDEGRSIFNPACASPNGTPCPPNDRLVFQQVDAYFRDQLQKLEARSRLTSLATPTLLAANNEVGKLFVGESRPITVGFNAPQVTAGGTTLGGTPITVLQNIGTSLEILPSINADRTVTLRIVQERSQVVPASGTIPVVGLHGHVHNATVDTVQRQTVSGTVVAADGLSIAIGGLIDESAGDSKSDAPLLGKLPGFGSLFKRQAAFRNRREMIVLVRPFLLQNAAEASAVSVQPNRPGNPSTQLVIPISADKKIPANSVTPIPVTIPGSMTPNRPQPAIVPISASEPIPPPSRKIGQEVNPLATPPVTPITHFYPIGTPTSPGVPTQASLSNHSPVLTPAAVSPAVQTIRFDPR